LSRFVQKILSLEGNQTIFKTSIIAIKLVFITLAECILELHGCSDFSIVRFCCLNWHRVCSV